MNRLQAAFGTIVFLIFVPGVVAGLIPGLISGWHEQPPLLGFFAVRPIGILLIALGASALLDSFARFALDGLGTPAPVLPTKTLVIRGLYRYVRNPMYIAVASIIVGQGLFFGDVHVLAYGLFVWVTTYLFVVVYEEPTLRQSFGADYDRYLARVPRWIPRFPRKM